MARPVQNNLSRDRLFDILGSALLNLLNLDSENQPDLFQTLLRAGHQGVFGRFAGRLVGDREPQVGPCVIPGDRRDRVLGDQVLAGRFGGLEGWPVLDALGAPRVEEVGAAGDLAVEAAAAERLDQLPQTPVVLLPGAAGDLRVVPGPRPPPSGWR